MARSEIEQLTLAIKDVNIEIKKLERSLNDVFKALLTLSKEIKELNKLDKPRVHGFVNEMRAAAGMPLHPYDVEPIHSEE